MQGAGTLAAPSRPQRSMTHWRPQDVEIKALPDNYAAAVGNGQLPDIFKEDGAWWEAHLACFVAAPSIFCVFDAPFVLVCFEPCIMGGLSILFICGDSTFVGLAGIGCGNGTMDGRANRICHTATNPSSRSAHRQPR